MTKRVKTEIRGIEKEILPFTKRVSDSVTQTMIDQDEFGLKKYGKALNPADDYDWLDMAQQELADCLKYFKAEQVKRDIVLGDVINDIEDMQMLFEKRSANWYAMNGIILKLKQLSKNV